MGKRIKYLYKSNSIICEHLSLSDFAGANAIAVRYSLLAHIWTQWNQKVSRIERIMSPLQKSLRD
jgi:hypothetical protein